MGDTDGAAAGAERTGAGAAGAGAGAGALDPIEAPTRTGVAGAAFDGATAVFLVDAGPAMGPTGRLSAERACSGGVFSF